MTELEVQERLEVVRVLIRETLKGFIGDPVTPENMVQVKRAVTMALAQADLSLRPSITELVDVVVETEPDDPTMLVVSFRRKEKKRGR